MKKLILLSTLLVSSLGLSLRADTIEGEAACAKCGLHTADSCQNAITVTGKDGKKETILCEKNDVAKAFHKTVCHDSAKVKAEGSISEKDGHKVITLTKIEEAK